MSTERVILLVDHGSRRAEANALLEQLAEAVRRRTEDAVRIAHLELADPDIGTAIDAAVADGARELVVVPFFLAPGRHTQHDIPALLREAAARHPSLRLRMGQPLGSDDAMVDLLLARAADARLV